MIDNMLNSIYIGCCRSILSCFVCDFEFSILPSLIKSPPSPNCGWIHSHNTLIINCMVSLTTIVLFHESDLGCIIVKWPLKSKCPHLILAIPLNPPCWARVCSEVFEVHGRILTTLFVVSLPHYDPPMLYIIWS